MPGSELERKKKEVIETFRKYGLDITIKRNLFIVIFLNTQFSLFAGTIKSY